MGNDKRDRQNREADLVREVDRLRFLLQQAGIDAEQSLRETKATGNMSVTSQKNVPGRMQLAPTSTKYVIGSRIRLQ